LIILRKREISRGLCEEKKKIGGSVKPPILNIVYNLDTTVKTVLYIVIYKQNAISFSRRVAVVYAFIPLD
jgi:hypothetical protein